MSDGIQWAGVTYAQQPCHERPKPTTKCQRLKAAAVNPTLVLELKAQAAHTSKPIR